MRFAPALAVLTTGVALYVSRGVLDQILTPDGPVRVALLPPLQALGGFLAIGALGLLWLDRRTIPHDTATAVRSPLAPLVLPTLALSVLLLPYLPVVADVMPALQMLAGPLRGVVWLVVGGQLLWVLWQSRLLRADWVQRWTPRQLAITIAVATVLVSAVAATRLTRTVLYPGGDEPHYLVIMQSLWRDGDLKIENNHARGDYREYFGNDLAPHYLTRGKDQEIYSIHPVGMPILMAPVYALGGYDLVVACTILLAAAAVALMWLAAVRLTNSPGGATFAWAAVALTTPFLFNSFAVYPEISAAIAVALAFPRAVGLTASAGLSRWLVVGMACAALPWLSTKYAPMSAAIVAIALARMLWPTLTLRPVVRASTTTAAAAVLIPYGVSLLVWFAFFYWIWGTPRPQAPYGGLVQTDVVNLVFGAPGLLFDQEYGLLPYAPIYILAATGLWALWRRGDESRRHAIEVALTFAALLGTVGAFRIWWGGSASPGRPVTSGLPLLMLPIAAAFGAATVSSARRAAHHLLLAISVGVAGILCFAQQGFLTNNGRDGTSSLLAYLSPRWPAWTVAPSFIYHETRVALAYAAVWLLLGVVAALLLNRVRTARAGVASLAAMSVCFAATLVAISVTPLLPQTPAWPAIDLRARSRLPVLDDYDAVARPLGVEYAPLGIISAADVTTHAALEADPGLRRDPQPIRVLLNGRFSLPAGRYRIAVEWSGSRSAETLALQIGRTGDPWRQWEVQPRAGETWSAELELPMDASFVGLRGSPELERTIGRIAFVPQVVVDAGRRPRLPVVIAASQSGPAPIFYFDTNAFPERQGFWVRGGLPTKVAIHRKRTDVPLVLRVHSGLIANQLHLSMPGWSHTISLEPQQPDQITVPAGDRALITLDLKADSAFIPSKLNPAVQDGRPLGAWIEVITP